MDSDDIQQKRVYKQPLNYENGIILPLIRDCCISRNKPDSTEYIDNVKTLGIVLPKELRLLCRDKFPDVMNLVDISQLGKQKIDDYFEYILEILEDHNICFPKLSFTRGHD